MLLPTPRSIVCIPTYILIATHFDVVAYIGRKVLHFRSKKEICKVPGASTYTYIYIVNFPYMYLESCFLESFLIFVTVKHIYN